MEKIILTYGILSGAVVIGSMILTFTIGMDEGSIAGLEYVGYLIMIVALAFIALGIKKYRDDELGGVITFGTGATLGLGIAVVAGVIYVLVWEVYLAMTDHAFINDYIAAAIEMKRSDGLAGAELDAYAAEMAEFKEDYRRPLYRVPLTFLEIFPVGLVIALVSAAFLRKSEIS